MSICSTLLANFAFTYISDPYDLLLSVESSKIQLNVSFFMDVVILMSWCMHLDGLESLEMSHSLFRATTENFFIKNLLYKEEPTEHHVFIYRYNDVKEFVFFVSFYVS